MDWAYHNPVKVYLLDGNGLRQRLASYFHGKRIAMLVSRRSVREYGLAVPLASMQAQNDVIMIDDTPSNPTFESIFHTLERFGGEKPDVLVAIGGGSVIDTAKAVSAMAGRQWPMTFEEFAESVRSKSYIAGGAGIPIYAAPTTAGTGAEMTMWGTVWDKANGAKHSVEALWLFPAEAWVVPELTVTMNARLTLSTGLDALSHAVEAYWSIRSNPVVRAIALNAVSLISENLNRVLAEPANLAHRAYMMQGALFAGLAFSNTRTTACHGLSYPMTIRWGIEHGLAVAMTLPDVLILNWPSVAEGDRLLAAWGLSTPEDARNWLDSLSQGIQPLRLGAFGVSQADAMELADAGLVKERMGNNPISLSKEDIQGILSRIM